MQNTFSRTPGKPVYGSLRDGVDVNNPSDVKAALAKLRAAKVKLPPILVEELERLEAESARKAQLAAAYEIMLEELERLFAAEDAAKARAESERTIVFPASPSADDDWLVIGAGLNELENTAGERYGTEQEIDGRMYRFAAHQLIHWVPASVGEAWPGRLPGAVHPRPPADLLRTLRSRFSRVNPLRSTADGNDVIFDEVGCLAEAARIVRGCGHRPLLELWLATTLAAHDEPNGKLGAVLTQRIAELEPGARGSKPAQQRRAG
jgi:hypothetical protein